MRSLLRLRRTRLHSLIRRLVRKIQIALLPAGAKQAEQD